MLLGSLEIPSQQMQHSLTLIRGTPWGLRHLESISHLCELLGTGVFSVASLGVASFTRDPEPLGSAKQELPLWLFLVLLLGLAELGDIVKSGINFYQVLQTAWEVLGAAGGDNSVCR